MPPGTINAAERSSRNFNMKRSLAYDTDVFINCPFDEPHQDIFQALVFAVLDCGFTPRCAREVDDGADNRLRKITAIIKNCRFGIHDISRTEYTEIAGELFPRFNMPLELGIFFGAREFCSGHFKQKTALILDRDPYRYRNFISDISGNDISSHKNDPEVAVKKVCDWLTTSNPRKIIPGGTAVLSRYGALQRDLPALCRAIHKTPDEINFVSFTSLILNWLTHNAYPS